MTTPVNERERLLAMSTSAASDDREEAAERLCRWASSEAVIAVLVGLATDPSEFVRARAVESLGSVERQKSSVGAVLRASLGDPDEIVRLNAVESLERLGILPSAHAIWQLLVSESDVLVRAVLAEALVHARGEKGEKIAWLEFLLASDKESRVRLSASYALYRLGQRRRWREVFSFLDDPDYHVRSAAVGVLEELSSPARREEIGTRLRERLSREPTVAVQSRIGSLLQALTGSASGD